MVGIDDGGSGRKRKGPRGPVVRPFDPKVYDRRWRRRRRQPRRPAGMGSVPAGGVNDDRRRRALMTIIGGSR